MSEVSRREFLKAFAAASGLLAVSFPSIATTAGKTKISFSTLGCPGWDLPQIISFARKHGYHGVEFRGLNGQLDLLRSPHFAGGNVAATRRQLHDSGLEIVCLGSSAQMHHREESDLKKHLDEARAYIDLADKLSCSFVRVFPEKLGGDDQKDKSIGWIAENLAKLGEYAKGSQVAVLLESHGDLVRVEDLQTVMTSAQSKNTGLIWDISNMWAVTGEAPDNVFRSLGPFIRHVHVKDVVKVNEKIRYVLPGKGVVPIAPALSALMRGGYHGFYSFEWEKLWHPELDEPESALAYYPQAIESMMK